MQSVGIKELREAIDINLKLPVIKGLIKESDKVPTPKRFSQRYKPEVIKRLKAEIVPLLGVKDKVESIYNYYGRPKDRQEPNIYVYYGIVFGLLDLGYKPKQIGYIVDRNRSTVYSCIRARKGYHTDRIMKIVIDDVYNRTLQTLEVINHLKAS